MAEQTTRDPRLGPWGLYSPEGVERVGLAQALADTANHLEHGVHKIKAQADRLEATREIDRLRVEAARARRAEAA